MDKMLLITWGELAGLLVIFFAIGLGLGVVLMMKMPNLDAPCNQNQGRGEGCEKPQQRLP